VKYVEIISFTSDPPRKLGEVQLVDGEILYKDLPKKLVDDLKRGIAGWGGEWIMPSQKLKFLENLKVEFSGSAMRATDVKERNSSTEEHILKCELGSDQIS
jgi:hypothetical protein